MPENIVTRISSLCFLSLLVWSCSSLSAQTAADSIYVNEVVIIGHKKTRSGVIFREMPFGRGDQLAIADLPELVAAAESNLMNTGLFTRVTISYADWQPPNNSVTFELKVEETWYLYPVPIFDLADRNFNVWWSEQNRSLDRVNFGVKFTHYNFSGRRDRFRLGFQYGYTRNYQIGYRLPYLGKEKNLGLEVNWSYARRREQNYATLDNKQVFYLNPDAFVYRNSEVRGSLSYRRRLYTSHRINMGWRHERIADTIATVLNPGFFGSGIKQQDFLWLEYQLEHDHRDIRGYPWTGDYARLQFKKSGLGLLGKRNGFTVRGDYRRYTPIGRRFSLNTSIAVKYSLVREQQPFLDNQAIGYGDNSLPGYQFYVIDGLDLIILRAGLRWELFKSEVNLPKLVFIEAFRRIPYRILGALQFDQGWANMPFTQEGNDLANTWLRGFSTGLDVVLYYDMALSLRYQYNHLQEGGFLIEFDAKF